jgi:hypothetical protein
LAAFLCARASAAVVETGGAAAVAAPVSGAIGSALGAGATMAPIPSVPGAALLAPSLNSASVVKSFSGDPAAAAPAKATLAAPTALPALPASAIAADAAPSSHRNVDGTPSSAAPARRKSLPPSSVEGQASVQSVSASRGLSPDSDAAAASRVDASGRDLSPSLETAGKIGHVPAAGEADLGRRVFDQGVDRADLANPDPATLPGAFASIDRAGSAAGSQGGRDGSVAALSPASGFSSDGEILHDAVGSPAASQAGLALRPGAYGAGAMRDGAALGGAWAPASPALPGPVPTDQSAAPMSFARLSLELGSDLAVKVRAVLGLETEARTESRPSTPPSGAAPASARAARVPLTSTEWLERRGLLESLSASEAAADQTALAASAAAAKSAAAPLPDLILAPARSARVSPLAWWALAFLPAGLVLLKELL